MDRYPDVPGHNNVHTSIAAATSVVEKADAIRTRLYKLLINGREITSEEAAEELGLKHDNCWKRFSELRAQGLAEDSGIERINKSGRAAIVWKLREEDGTDVNYGTTKAYLRERVSFLEREVARLREENKRLKPVQEQMTFF